MEALKKGIRSGRNSRYGRVLKIKETKDIRLRDSCYFVEFSLEPFIGNVIGRKDDETDERLLATCSIVPTKGHFIGDDTDEVSEQIISFSRTSRGRSAAFDNSAG
jgi:hypothetical protein